MVAIPMPAEAAIASGSDDEGDALIRGAEKYIEQHGIRRLLTSLLVELAQHQPPDPIAALQEYLAALDRGGGFRYEPQCAASHVHQGEVLQLDCRNSPLQEQQHQKQEQKQHHLVEEDQQPPADQQHLQEKRLAKTAGYAEQVVGPATSGEGPLALESNAGACRASNPAAAIIRGEMPEQVSDSPADRSRARPPEASVEPAEECDLEDNQAAPPLSPMQMLLCERLPTSSSRSISKAALGKAEDHDRALLDLSAHRCWAGGFNRWLLEGWVPQPSPCCAAASVAGAFNAIWGHGRRDNGRATVRECADIMADHCDQLREQRQQRLERLLGVPEGAFDDFLVALDAHIEASGLKWTARIGPKAVTKAAALAAVHEVLMAPPTLIDGANSGDSCDGESGIPSQYNAPFGEDDRNIFVALREVIGVTLDKEAGSEASEHGADVSTTAPAPAVASVEEPTGGVVVSLSSKGNTDWKHELQELLTKRKAVFRLRAEKPNTSEVGSWGIKQAAESLAFGRGVEPLRVTCLLGRKGGGTKGVEIPVSKNDDEAAVEKQWSAVRAAFGRPYTALIFHLTNHYALIFAWREWLEEVTVEAAEAAQASEASAEKMGPGEEASASEAVACPVSHDRDSCHPATQLRWRLRRQLLTARKGQRPSVWINFEEVRAIIGGWSGYNLLVLQRLNSN